MEDSEIIEQPKEKKLERAVSLAGLGKRSIAGVIDLFIMLFVLMGIFNLVIQPIFNSAFKVNELNKSLFQLRVDSKLYDINEENSTFEVKEADYLDTAKEYFESYCGSNEDGSKACSIVGKSFADAVLEYEQFKDYYYKDAEGNLAYIGEENQKDEIEVRVYEYAIYEFQSSDAYKTLTHKIDTYFNAEFYISLFLSSLIFYLVLPLCLKDGKTLGKLMFKMSLTNPQGYKVRKSQIVVRFFSFFVINFLFGIFTFFIIPFVSFTIMIFSKNSTAIHDYCSATIVVDDMTSVIYDSQKHHEDMKLQEDLNYERILMNRKKLRGEEETKETDDKTD